MGLANQFRECIARYALLVSALTALVRGPEKRVVPTPEALLEFENLKVILSSAPVLQQFRYTRPTIVYTDASAGSLGLPGGLGVVIAQTDEDGKDYVCAYASAGLTSAQRNYHIVRLELLAFVSSSMTGWWRSVLYDARTVGHTNFCTKHPYHRTPQLRGKYALAEFDLSVEWIPGVSMIADSFSRMQWW